MTLINIVMFLLGLTTAFAIVGVIALRDWHAKSKKNETEEEEQSLLRTPRT